MSYISQKARQELNEWFRSPASPGELNYVITQAVLDYLNKFDLSYRAFNEAIQCAGVRETGIVPSINRAIRRS